MARKTKRRVARIQDSPKGVKRVGVGRPKSVRTAKVGQTVATGVPAPIAGKKTTQLRKVPVAQARKQVGEENLRINPREAKSRATRPKLPPRGASGTGTLTGGAKPIFSPAQQQEVDIVRAREALQDDFSAGRITDKTFASELQLLEDQRPEFALPGSREFRERQSESATNVSGLGTATKIDRRAEPGAPLGPGAGAQGIPGDLGFNEEAILRRSFGEAGASTFGLNVLTDQDEILKRLQEEADRSVNDSTMERDPQTGELVERGILRQNTVNRAKAILSGEFTSKQDRERQQAEFDIQQNERIRVDEARQRDQQRRETTFDTGDLAGFGAGALDLPPEAQFLSPAFQSVLDSIALSSQQSAQSTQALLQGGVIDVNGQPVSVEGVSNIYDNVDRKFAELESGYINMQGNIQGMIDRVEENNQKMISRNQGAEENRLAWEGQKLTREKRNNKTKAVESRIAALALRGRIQSDSGMREVEEVRFKYEQQINNIQIEIGVQKTELGAKYTGLYVESTNSYLLNSANNLKDTMSSLERIAGQSLASTQAKANSNISIITEFVRSQETNRKEYRKELNAHIQKAEDEIANSKNADTTQRNALWDRLFQQRAQDGNLNPGFTQGILDDLQALGEDISGIDASSMTESQANELQRRVEKRKADSGRKPLGKQVEDLKDLEDAMDLIAIAEKDLKQFAGVGGPIGGMTAIGDIDPGFVGSIGKFFADVVTGFGAGEAFEKQREATAAFNIVKQIIGKGLEDGVLRKEDEVKYAQILPNLRDSDRIRNAKLTRIKEVMNAQKRNQLETMRRNGFNTSGYEYDSDGKPFDLIEGSDNGYYRDDEAQDVMQKLESNEPLSFDTGTKFLNTLAIAHSRHEGFGTPNAVTITKGNNPGALKFHPSNERFGSKRGKNNFAMFPDIESGYRALMSDLNAKISGGSAHIDYSKDPTLLTYVKIYAPATDGNNPTAYSRRLVNALNDEGYDVNINTPLTILSRFI